MVQLIVQISSGLVAPYLSDEFNLGPFYGNVLVSSVFFLHILMQVPAGLLIEKFGARRVLGIGASISFVGALLFSFSAGFFSAIMTRMLMGVGLSCSFVGITSIIGGWFPSHQFTLMVSLAEMLGLLIGAIAEHWLPQVLQQYSWRVFFKGVSLACLVLSLVILLFLRNGQQAQEIMQENDALTHLKLAIKNWRLWVNGLYSGALFAVVTGFVAGDATQMLAAMPGWDLASAADFCAVIMYGVVIGSGIMGWVSSRFTHREILTLMTAAAFVSAMSIAAVIWLGSEFMILRAVACLVLGIFTSAYLLSFRVLADWMNMGKGRNVLIGFTNMLSVLPGPVFSVLAGFIQRIQLDGQAQVILESQVDFHGFQLTNSLFIAVLVLGSFLAFMLLRTRAD